MSLSSSCHPLVVNKPHPHSCCGASLQRQCLYFILIMFYGYNAYGINQREKSSGSVTVKIRTKRESRKKKKKKKKKNITEMFP